MANNLILTACAERRNIIKVSDEHLSLKVIRALQESGFLQFPDGWTKITLNGTLTLEQTIARLSEIDWPSSSKEALNTLDAALRSSPNLTTLLGIEKALWPLKIKDVEIPAFIVPIRPEWAMHLFDVDIAGQDLFGGEPSLILNAENVYYRASRPKILCAPGRVLWYVSSGSRKYQGSMYIKACSYIDDVEIGKPKQLFSRYKKLGIYRWKDVYNEVAKGDLNKDIMAFRFSKTEILKTPIHYSKLRKIWGSNGQNFNPIAPLQISKERFFKLYSLGMKGQ